MPDYKFYCLDPAGHIQLRRDIKAADDDAALKSAKAMCSEFPIEIWEGARFIIHVAMDGTTSKCLAPILKRTG